MTALSEVVICNMALTNMGVSYLFTDGGDGLIANATGGDATALSVCQLWYERCRNQTLEDFPWQFARKFSTLTLADAGEGEVWRHEWENAYAYPDDCLKIRRFVNDVGTGYYPANWTDQVQYGRVGDRLWAWRYVIRMYEGKKVILTDVTSDDADIEYTFEATDERLFSETFAEALSWRIAARIALPLSIDREKVQWAAQNYVTALESAAAHSDNEENDHDDGDDEFVRSRGGF